MMGAKQWLVFGVACAGVWGCGANADESVAKVDQAVHEAEPVGLSLFFENGQAAPLKLLGAAPRFLQEIDITESVASATDEGIRPLITNSGASSLDWRGVEQVEEIWVPSLDGTFTREHYYRNARWMENSGTFTVVALDARGQQVGSELVAHAGTDDRRKPQDDGFSRRFSARQLAVGCPSVGNCAGATFTSEALIQFRDALHPERDARTIPASATGLRLSFDQFPRSHHYDVALERLAPHSLPFGYGFQVGLEPLGTPANGSYYLPGESVSLRVTFSDGQGNRLYPQGALPTFGAVLSGRDPGGLRYLNLQLQTRLYYALKHREANLLMVLSGPTNALKTPATVVDPSLLFGSQVPFATRAVDGFTAVGQTIPSAGIIFGGLADPSVWNLPVSDVVTFTIPADAEPGTYVGAVKARREFAGEALNRAGSVDIQVGQAASTHFTPKTACTSCHSEERTNFQTILHGIGDRRACFGCHSSLGIEFDNALDIRVHTIHDRSDRFGADVHNCTNCHLATPDAPARGLLPSSTR
jgi:predicted CXXCH cytochrome family protein